MAKHRWDQALARVLKHEGGFTANPKDPGNWTGGKVGVGQLKGTQKGISAASFPNLDIRNLTVGQVSEIYRGKYWNPIRGDALPGGVDYSTFDFGVNSGISRSAKYLQAVVGTKQDGNIGALTLKAVSIMAPEKIVRDVCRKRTGFLQGLSTWATFGRGWAARVADVEATGVKWALEDKGANASQIAKELDDERKRAENAAKNQGIGGTATTTGGAGTSTVAVPEFDFSNSIDVILTVGAVALLAVGAFLVYRHFINRSRAKSYAAAIYGDANA